MLVTAPDNAGREGKAGLCAAATGFAMMAVARIVLGLAVFAVFAVLSIPFVARCVPETKGRSLGGDRT